MPRAEIIWKRRSPEGETVQVRARHFAHQWEFSSREARYDQWKPLEKPPLEDWLTLLDGVKRRLGRGSVRSAEVTQIERIIRERFPGTEL